MPLLPIKSRGYECSCQGPTRSERSDITWQAIIDYHQAIIDLPTHQIWNPIIINYITMGLFTSVNYQGVNVKTLHILATLLSILFENLQGMYVTLHIL